MDIRINGPKILFEIPWLGGIQITETIANTWLLMAIIALAAKFLTQDMRIRNPGKRQVMAETLVCRLQQMAEKNSGKASLNRCAFIAALFSIALFSGICGLFGLFSPAADLSGNLGWALVVFALITAGRIRSRGFSGYLRAFAEPAAFMAPINIISEISLPVSMAFRIFGNIASGTVVMALVYAALKSLSEPFFGIPILQVGIPALFSVYFDVFAGALQAFIFTMLAMIYLRLAEE